MKKPHCNRIQRLMLAAVLSTGLGLGFSSHVFAETHSYIVDLNSKRITELGSLGEGPTYAQAINDAGQVVGYSSPYTEIIAPNGAGRTDLGTHAFITGPNGAGMTDLGTLGGNFSKATGINNAGQVVGWSYTDKPNTYHAFITGPNGAGMTDLGTLGGNFSIATSINAAGEVAGYSSTPAGATHAFITGPDGAGMTDLGTLGGVTSQAYGINDSGQVAGFSDTTDGSVTSFITGAGGVGMTATSAGESSNAYGINNSGQVAGDVYRGGADYAFITGPNGVGVTDLVGGQAHAINAAGEVTGISGNHTFVTGPNGVGRIDLNSFLTRSDGFVFVNAMGINNNGQVIAVGTAGIVAEPQSYGLMLAGLMLVGFIVRGKQKV